MNNYSALERAFHRIVLGSHLIQEVSFYLERFLDRKQSEPYSQNPVFVMGLARSGTTTLLRLLQRTGYFESLSYRDVPFVLMPSLWDPFHQKFIRQMELVERAHGDGIFVDFDSPEGFETIFWRTFADEKYIFDSVMKRYKPSDRLLRRFRTYMGLVANAHGEGKRYLSKNNNNLLRVETLAEKLPDARLLVLWRDPLQTAYSLFKMHQKFSKAQSEDPFILEYMNLIGHFEFGLNHKPFEFERPFQTLFSLDDPNYWLSYWIYVHSHILQLNGSDNVVVLNYDELCLDPQKQLQRIFQRIGVDLDAATFEHGLRQSRTETLPEFQLGLVSRAEAIAIRLTERFGATLV
jgi:hypothetical protein